MKKVDLIDQMASDAKITKVDAKKALDSFLSNVSKTLKKGDKISLVGFGTWSVAQRDAREGRNPQTGQVIQIPAKKVVKFKPGSELSDSVNI